MVTIKQDKAEPIKIVVSDVFVYIEQKEPGETKDLIQLEKSSIPALIEALKKEMEK